MSQNTKLHPLTEDDLAQVSGGAGIAAPTSAPTANIQNMDIEAALMMVQSQRTALLDGQLKTQTSQVQQRNETIADLNGAVKTFAAIGDALTGNQTATGATKAPGQGSTLESAIKTLESQGIETGKLREFAKDGFSKDELSQLVAITKSHVDSQSNSQQMDMLRLQSMSNKRNEAFDVMTNFVKKMQESRSSIIGNMR
jgi:arsenate reductase-like glutaredoxin family protein